MVIATFFIISPSTRIPPPHRNTDKPSGYFPAYPCVPLSGHRERFSPSASATNKLFRLFRCPGICRMSVRIQSALIADAYAATVPGAAVRTHFQKLAVLGHTSVTTDIKMIPHRAETSRLVVTEQLLGGVIPGGACGAAMNDDIFHGSGGCHHRAVLLSEESTFVRDLFLTDYHRESFLNHG